MHFFFKSGVASPFSNMHIVNRLQNVEYSCNGVSSLAEYIGNAGQTLNTEQQKRRGWIMLRARTL
jgi:hypothetical protein